MIALAVASLIFAKGDSWTSERVLHYSNPAEGINYAEVERLDEKIIRADKTGYSLQVLRRGTATLIGEDRIPVPEGPPEESTVELAPDGAVAKPFVGVDPWSIRILRIELSARKSGSNEDRSWSVDFPAQKPGPDVATIRWTAAAQPSTYTFEYREGATSEVIAIGTAKLTSTKRLVESMTLTCNGITLPSSGYRVRLKVEQHLSVPLR